MRYWIYKVNIKEGPAGYSGDWLQTVFSDSEPTNWGGHSATRSAEVRNYLNNDLETGDVIVAYQTDLRAVVGFCRISGVLGVRDDHTLQMQPIHVLAVPFRVHEAKVGTTLEKSLAVNGPVMLRELPRDQMEALVSLTGAPKRVLQGRPS